MYIIHVTYWTLLCDITIISSYIFTLKWSIFYHIIPMIYDIIQYEYINYTNILLNIYYYTNIYMNIYLNINILLNIYYYTNIYEHIF